MSDTQKEPQEIDPNAPWSPEEAEIQVGLSEEELMALQSQVPIIQETLEWFDEQIADFLNPNVIESVTVKTTAEDVKQAVLFAQKMSKGYSKKRKQFVKRFKQYLEPPKPPEE